MKRAFVLLVVLTTLALAAAIVAPLGANASVDLLAAIHRGDAVRHRVAGDSVIALLPMVLNSDTRLREGLDRNNLATLDLSVGEITVRASIADDSAKLPLRALSDSTRPGRVIAALSCLQSRLPLPRLAMSPENIAAECFDDLFEAETDADLFGTLTSRGWSQDVSLCGLRLNVRRASVAVLEATLRDLQPGLGESLARARTASKWNSVDELLLPLELTQAVKRGVLERLVDQGSFYSVLIRTSCGDQVRRRYVVVDAHEPPNVVIDWEVGS